MLNEEDPVRATIPPGSTAGRTAARTALTGADLHRPVPRRPAPEVLAAALALIAAPPPACPRLAANQQITFRHPNICFRGPQALKVRTGWGRPRQLDETSGGDGIPHACPVTGPARTRHQSPAHTLGPGPARHVSG